MTEKELRQRLIDRARSYLGCKEADGSHRPILDRYNRIRPLPRGYRMAYTDPWCAAFVSAAAADCGVTEWVFPECSCEAMIARYRAAGRFEERDEAVPRPGDLIFYDWEDTGAGDCRGQADHVGLVTAVNGSLLRVIEGNRSDAVGERNVYLDSRYIRGYGKPDYAAAAEALTGSDAAKAAPEPSPAKTRDAPEPSLSAAPAAVSLSLPVLRRGDRGECVRAAQLLLIGRGWRCGPEGADGDFGPGTYGGLLRFQRGRQLRADGVLGPQSWRALLGLEAE